MIPFQSSHAPYSPNAIYNPDFRFFQRIGLNSFASITHVSSGYGPDRWKIATQNGYVTCGRSTLNNDSIYTGLFAKSTSGKFMVYQPLTYEDTFALKGKAVVFYANLWVSGTPTITVRMGLLAHNGTADSITGTPVSAWGSDGVTPTWGTGLSLIAPSQAILGSISGSAITVPSLGLTPITVGGIWNIPADNSVDNLIPVFWSDNQTTDSLGITCVRLHPGNFIQPWQPVNYHAELIRCQAFYEKTFDVDVAPSQNAGRTGALHAPLVAASGGQVTHYWTFKTSKWKTPTITLYNPSATNDQVRRVSGNADFSSSFSGDVGLNGCDIGGTPPGGSSAAQTVAVHASADAEL